MEMESIFWGESEKAYFKYEDLNRSRSTISPILPMTDEEFIGSKDTTKKRRFYKKKKKNELRILGIDTAIMGGRRLPTISVMV